MRGHYRLRRGVLFRHSSGERDRPDVYGQPDKFENTARAKVVLAKLENGLRSRISTFGAF